MKNQSDLIVTIVAVLCMLIGVGVAFGTKKEALKPQPPEKVVTAPLQLPAGDVAMAASLPGAGNTGGGGVGAPGGPPGGGGFMGAMGGPPQGGRKTGGAMGAGGG